MHRKTSIQITEDGSHTLYVPHLDEHYHSIHGAIQESKHVFINAGLRHAVRGFHQLNIFEVGFGTGLNAILSLAESNKLDVTINYTSIEAYPLEAEIFGLLNYTDNGDLENYKNEFRLMHSCEWGTKCKISNKFNLLKLHGRVQDFRSENKFNLIYFDAFGPDKQPDCWMPDIFERIGAATEPEGVLVTYTVKGEVKRALKQAGFDIKKLAGPPGKREMLRAVKK